MLELDTRSVRRKPSLTPMIDVVFLLLVFFMLAARFGLDQVIEIRTAEEQTEESTGYSGAPRFVEVTAAGLMLNGIALPDELVVQNLSPLMPTADAVVILRNDETATVQDLVDALDLLHGAEIRNTVVIE